MTSRSGSLAAGLAGGLIAGVVFGLLMQMMGAMPMVAMLVRSESIVVGWIVHLAIAAFIGASYALLLGPWARTLVMAASLGLAYGAVWWVLGALTAMPAILGMPLLNVNDMAMQSLMGHLMYGVVLGVAYGLIRPRLG